MVYFESAVGNAKERSRYVTLKRTLEPLRPLFADRLVLDFGASHGPGICALLELGARRVVGVEPEPQWVDAGQRLLAASPYGNRAELHHVPDTRRLPFPDGAFDFVLVNAVLEHIAQPRAAYIREIWRVLHHSGHLLVSETPNKYLPKEVHTTQLWFVHWLPSPVARAYAIRRGRYTENGDWTTSGWRGLGYFELVRALESGYELRPERSRLRHRVLSRVGLPASVIDPYPTWILRKV